MRLAPTMLVTCVALALHGMTAGAQTQPLPKPVTPPLPLPGSSPKSPSPNSSPDARAVPAERAASFIDSFIDDQTLAVVQFDLSNLDSKNLRESILSGVDELRKTDKEVGRARADVGEQLDKTFKKVEEFRSAGVKQLYMVVSMADFTQGQPPFLVVPLETGTDAKPIEQLLDSLDPDGAGNDPKTAARPADDLLRASVLRDAVVDAGPRTLGRLKTLRPGQSEVGTALAAAGRSQVRLAVVAQAGARGSLEQLAPNLPPALGGGSVEPVSRGLQWLSIGIALPPLPSVKMILQAKDPESAAKLQDIVEKAIAWAGDRKQGPREALVFTQLVSKLKPVVDKDRVLVELNEDEARQLPGVIAAGLLNARSMAAQSQSMSNLKQLDVGILMYANDHNGAMPRDLGADIQPYLGGNARQLWTDPLRPNQQHPYVYLKLADKLSDVHDPARSIVLYENHTTWDNGVNAAFADGHTEWFSDEKLFKENLAETKKMNPAAAEMPQ